MGRDLSNRLWRVVTRDIITLLEKRRNSMAALQVKEDSATGQLTLRSPLAARLGSSAFGLIWIVLLGAFFVLPMLSSGNIDWSNLLFVLVIFLFSGGSSLLSALTSTTVTIDASSRT